MTRGRRRILSTFLVVSSAMLAVALSFLWWRSRTVLDILAWTTGRVHPAVAAGQLPPNWNRWALPFSRAANTFSIHSGDGLLWFHRDTYLSWDAPKGANVPYPFPELPSIRPVYQAISYGPLKNPLSFQPFQSRDARTEMYYPQGSNEQWVFQRRSISVPHWAAVVAMLLPACLYTLGQFIRLRRTRVGLCQRCGYDLRASPERCPECGAAVTAVASPAVR